MRCEYDLLLSATGDGVRISLISISHRGWGENTTYYYQSQGMGCEYHVILSVIGDGGEYY